MPAPVVKNISKDSKTGKLMATVYVPPNKTETKIIPLISLTYRQLIVLYQKFIGMDSHKQKADILVQIPRCLDKKVRILEELSQPSREIFDDFILLFTKKETIVNDKAVNSITTRIIPALEERLDDDLIPYDLDILQYIHGKISLANHFPSEKIKKTLLTIISKKIDQIKSTDFPAKPTASKHKGESSSETSESESSSSEDDDSENEEKSKFTVEDEKKLPDEFRDLLDVEESIIKEFELYNSNYRLQCSGFEKAGEDRLIEARDLKNYTVFKRNSRKESLNGFRTWFYREMQATNNEFWGTNNIWNFSMPAQTKPLKVELCLLRGSRMKIPVVRISDPKRISDSEEFNRPLLLHCFHDIVVVVGRALTEEAKKTEETEESEETEATKKSIAKPQAIKKSLVHVATGLKFDFNINHNYQTLNKLVEDASKLFKIISKSIVESKPKVVKKVVVAATAAVKRPVKRDVDSIVIKKPKTQKDSNNHVNETLKTTNVISEHEKTIKSLNAKIKALETDANAEEELFNSVALKLNASKEEVSKLKASNEKIGKKLTEKIESIQEFEKTRKEMETQLNGTDGTINTQKRKIVELEAEVSESKKLRQTIDELNIHNQQLQSIHHSNANDSVSIETYKDLERLSEGRLKLADDLRLVYEKSLSKQLDVVNMMSVVREAIVKDPVSEIGQIIENAKISGLWNVESPKYDELANSFHMAYFGQETPQQLHHQLPISDEDLMTMMNQPN